jgi:signal transduction histidine kinase
MSNILPDSEVSVSTDDRMIVLMRLVLAISALLIIYIDPAEPDRFVFATYLALILYTFYSGVFYFLFIAGYPFVRRVISVSHWLDVAWFVLFIALSSGTGSIFFFFFIFAILTASFSYGFESGLKVTLVSSVSFTIIGYLTSPGGQEFELNRFLLRPIYLTVLGYMMAYRGGHEIKIKRRLALLKEISIVANPRFGVDRTIGIVIDLIRKFYRADECLLIMTDIDTDEFIYYQTGHNGRPERQISAFPLNPMLQKCLTAFPEHRAVIYHRRNLWSVKPEHIHEVDLIEEQIPSAAENKFRAVAERLDAKSYLTVPVYRRREYVGRLFIISHQACVFEPADIHFMLQAIDQFMPAVENIRLVDYLASNAANDERKKIARDIHDSIIQPYIGLQLGVDSIIQFLELNKADESGDPAKVEKINDRMQRLRGLTEKGITDLRDYIHGLSRPRGHEGNLLPAVRRFAEKFTKATGIEVEIQTSEEIRITDRLAAEFFQIIVEGLSNIRRHTHSPKASIEFISVKDKIVLAIGNNTNDNGVVAFTPRSISERAKLLGGEIKVELSKNKTIVRIEVPL